jgi:adenylate kinase
MGLAQGSQILMTRFAFDNARHTLKRQRIPGVSAANQFGSSYSMRIWLNPDKLRSFRISAAEVLQTVRAQNVQFATGAIGSAPSIAEQQITAPVSAEGRFSSVEEFENVILRTEPNGTSVRLKDVARVELGLQDYGFDVIIAPSFGDIFRQNVRTDTELGREARSYMDAGELVPDDVVVRMVVAALEAARNGFILDGFPRTIVQAEALEQELIELDRPLTAVLAFHLEEELAVKRLAGRRTCAVCQRTYNVEFHPPQTGEVCDYDGTPLAQRSDDEEHTVRHRQEVYRASARPLESFYESRGLMRVVDADASEDVVTDRAVHALAKP